MKLNKINNTRGKQDVLGREAAVTCKKLEPLSQGKYSQPLIIRNSFIRKPCYPDRISRNGTLTMENTLVFPEICFPDPEVNFPDKICNFLYKFPWLSGSQMIQNPENEKGNCTSFVFSVKQFFLKIQPTLWHLWLKCFFECFLVSRQLKLNLSYNLNFALPL